MATLATNVEAPRRQAILDAALTCFLRSGVAGTTIDAIQRESGASVGSIYHFFGSKEGVAAELYLDTLRDYFDTYLAALRNSRMPAAARPILRILLLSLGGIWLMMDR